MKDIAGRPKVLRCDNCLHWIMLAGAAPSCCSKRIQGHCRKTAQLKLSQDCCDNWTSKK